MHMTMTKRKSANFYKTSTRPPLLLSTRHEALHDLYSKGTSLIRNSAPLGPYSRPIPRIFWRSWGGRRFIMSKVPLYRAYSNLRYHKLMYTPDLGLRTFIKQGPYTDPNFAGMTFALDFQPISMTQCTVEGPHTEHFSRTLFC